MPIAPSATPAFHLDIPVPKMLTVKEELAIAHSAHAVNPESPLLTRRLASLLIRLDHFDEVIGLLNGFSNEDFDAQLLLHSAYISHETAASDHLAQVAAEKAVHVAQTSSQRAFALAQLAKSFIRLGKLDTARTLLEHTLEIDPQQKDAYKRYFALLLEIDPEKALTFAKSMIAKGVVHSRALGSAILALTKLNRMQEAREIEGFDQFFLRKEPETPAGWASLQHFNDALTAEILTHPDMRYERYGTASSFTWRIDEPALRRSRIFPQVQELIRQEVQRYACSLEKNGHPILQGMPAKAKLRNWCVVTKGDGYEAWHVHQNGWMSGVYYIHVQDHISQGTGSGGCIAFGIPEEIVGEPCAKAFGERVIRPYTGLMMIFPSHVYHRTYPHRGPGRRICFAFDIIPESIET